MTIYQISTILNAVAAESVGSTAVVSADLTNLISLGNLVLSSQENVDKFTNALVDRIGRTIISMRPYKRRDKAITFNTFEFGAVLQKIYVEPVTAVDAPQWDLTAGESIDQYIITPPKAKQKLFGDLSPFEIDITIPDYQLRTAFTSGEQMAAFIDAIFLSVQNSLELRLENYAAIAYANFIGEKIAYSATQNAKGIHVVNLLADYNELTGGNITASTAFTDYEFLQYAAEQLDLYTKRLETYSTLFNTEQYQRFTPRDYQRLTVHADFATAIQYHLRSSTYHENLVSLPNYSEIPFWQGSGVDYKRESTEQINITTASGESVNQAGVVALLTDIEAIGCLCDMHRVNSVRNNRGEYTNYFYKADMRYYNDMSENGIVFIVADIVADSD